MSAEIVFLVESIDYSGRPYTLGERLKALSPEWIEHFHSEIIDTYLSCTGKKIIFQPYSAIQNLDPNKKYYYFISVDHLNFDFSVYFQMLGRTKLMELHQRNIPIYFAHDLETLPHVDYTFFIKQLEWLFLMRGVYSHVDNEIIFATASSINPAQRYFIDQYFNRRFKFVHSPLPLRYATNELKKIHPTVDEIERLNLKNKFRQFTCLNRGSRFHRILFLHGLRSCGLMEEGYISNSQGSISSPNIIWSNTEYADILKKDMAEPMPSMTLDEYYTNDNRPAKLPSFPDQLWHSYYDVVAETGIPYNLPNQIEVTMLTEKTVKSLLFMRPFMINGGPLSLAYLKNIGFKTYDDIFDESYDQAQDLIERQRLILRNIFLYKNKYDELRDKVKASKDKLSFNRDHVLNMDYEQVIQNELMSIL